MKIEDEIRQPKFRSLNHKVSMNLIFTANWLQTKQQEFLKPFGVTASQYNILRILRGQHPNKISGVEIKSRMLDRNSDIPRLLDRLIKKELISKEISASDKRAADVAITEQGLQLLAQIDLLINEKEMEQMNLTEEEATQLSSLLDRCRG
jgi:DNA-binding MarR family transcriptional regulator